MPPPRGCRRGIAGAPRAPPYVPRRAHTSHPTALRRVRTARTNEELRHLRRLDLQALAFNRGQADDGSKEKD